MNRTLYRLIFNASRGCLMAVAEVGRSCGKAASGEGGGSHGGSADGGTGSGQVYMPNGLLARVNIAQAPIKTIAFAAALLCTGWGQVAWAQAVPATTIVVNAAAPAGQRPTLTTTASGITQVNIQSAVGGVSRNQYTQFDVGSPGLILNNSPVSSNTQLAGWVAGNTNLAGRIEAKTLTLGASQDITNTGGAFIAEQALAANAGRDLKVSTTTLDSTQGASTGNLQTRSTNISRVAGLYVTGDAGTLLASAGRDADLVGALLQSQGSASVSAARNLNLATVTTSASMDAIMDAGNYNRTSRSAEVGTSVQSAGATTLTAGNNITARAADVQAQGTLSASAGNNVIIEAGQSTNSVESARTTKNSGFLSSSTRTERSSQSSTRTERSSQSSTQTVASNFGGNNVTITSGQDIGVKASNVTADQNLSMHAGRDVVIESGQTIASSSAYSKLTESGLSGDIMSGASVGESMQAQAATSHTTTQVASTVSARNVSIQSTRDTTVAASNVLADQDISVVAGGKVNILAATNTQASSQQSESSSTKVGMGGGLSGRVSLYADTQTQGNGSNTVTSQSTSVLSANGGNLSVTANGGALTTQGADLLAADTITLQGKTVDLQAIADQQTSANHFESRSVTVGSALSGTVGSLITAIGDNVQLANSTKNERLKNAASLKAGYDAYKFVNGGLDKLSQAGSAAGSANGDPSGSAIGVSISVGVSSSSQDSASASTQVRGTNAQAKTINITATEGDLSATAAKLQADDISLEAAQNITLQAGANTSTVSSRNDSSSTGAGVTVGVGQQSGISFQLSASQANGRANGSETTFDNTQVSASKTLRVKSGTDTTLAGAQLAGDTVQMDVGGQLNIQTLQSSSTYQNEQHSSGFSVSVCVPPICYGVPVTGSVSMANQSLNHNYQSATGQSGIAAGQGGFDIKVAGNTDLQGGAITSSATPDKNTLQTASLTSTDLDNRQTTHSSSSSLNLGYSGASTLATLAQNAISNGLGNLGAGEGLPENGSQSGKTRSVISAGNITITGTGHAAQDANSQQQVASLTSRDAKTANQSLTNTLTLQQAQAVQEQQKTAQENAQAGQLVGSVAFNVVGDIAQKNGWKDSSPQKIALHAIAGFIQASAAGQNGASGALAAMGNEALTSAVNEAIDSALPMPPNATAEQQREVNLSRKALAESAASLLGATTVALAGGSQQQIAQGGAVALNADRFNRQLHPDERKWAKDNASKYKAYLKDKTGETVSTEEAYQRLLSAGYAVVDTAAQNTGKSDEVAKQFIGETSPKTLFAATVAERNSPLLGGNADGSYTPEQQARFGVKNPSELVQVRVQAAQSVATTTCDTVACAGNKVQKIVEAVTALEQQRTLYQDDPVKAASISEQQNQLLGSLSKQDILGAKLQAADEALILDVLTLPTLGSASAARASTLGRLTARVEGVGANGGVKIAGEAAPGPVNLMGNGDQFFKNAAKRTDIDPNGSFDVIAHGSAQNIEVMTTRGPVTVDQRVAGRLIENSPGYTAGQPVRLLSCDTGACDAGFAQNLANKMGVPVQAPTELVWAYGNGSMVVAPRTSLNPSSPLFNVPDLSRQGTFRTFTPGAKP